MKKIILLTWSVLLLNACAKAPGPAVLPAVWYQLPENAGPVAPSPSSEEPEPALPEAAGETFDQVLGAQQDALEALPARVPGVASFTPWHLGAFMTDLAVSAKGILGALTLKGTPAISLIWRKKGAARTAAPEALPAEISLSSETDGPALAAQLEGAVQAAIASGKIADHAKLRENLTRAVGDFRALTQGLESNPGREWWVSRFRLDVSVDVSGKVGFFTSLGAETRLRFEWHRIQRARASGAAAPVPAASPSEAKRSFDRLVLAVASDLTALSPRGDDRRGYQAYTFRVGVGVTAGTKFGIAKGSASAVGHIQFSRDVPKPGAVAPLVATRSDLEDDGTVALIETAPPAAHLRFAAARAVPIEPDGGALERVLYRVNRQQFRKGLRRAGAMARFFARRASRVRPGRWGVYELRTSFDISISGKFGISTVGGLAASEINFYNEEF